MMSTQLSLGRQNTSGLEQENIIVVVNAANVDDHVVKDVHDANNATVVWTIREINKAGIDTAQTEGDNHAAGGARTDDTHKCDSGAAARVTVQLVLDADEESCEILEGLIPGDNSRLVIKK